MQFLTIFRRIYSDEYCLRLSFLSSRPLGMGLGKVTVAKRRARAVLGNAKRAEKTTVHKNGATRPPNEWGQVQPRKEAKNAVKRVLGPSMQIFR